MLLRMRPCKAPVALQDDGIVAKLLVKAGTKDIPVGTPMAVLVEEAEHVAAFKDYQAGQSGAESKPEPEAQPSSSGRHHHCSACLHTASFGRGHGLAHCGQHTLTVTSNSSLSAD